MGHDIDIVENGFCVRSVYIFRKTNLTEGVDEARATRKFGLCRLFGATFGRSRSAELPTCFLFSLHRNVAKTKGQSFPMPVVQAVVKCRRARSSSGAHGAHQCNVGCVHLLFRR